MSSVHRFEPSKAARVFPRLVPQEQIEATLPAHLQKRRARGLSMLLDRLPDRALRTTALSFSTLHEHGELFVNYLKMRKEVFIRRKGWPLPEAEGMEFDQYDTPQARWIVLHEYGEILAGVRIAPTTARCGLHSYMIRDAQLGLLPDLPPSLLYFDAPVSDHIWEATRLFVSPMVPSRRRQRIQYLLLKGMADTGRAEGASHVIGIVPAVFRRWMNRVGMTATAVGPVMSIDGDRVQAALMDVSFPQSGRIPELGLPEVA